MLVLGALAGVLYWVRPQSALVALLPLGLAADRCWREVRAARPRGSALRTWAIAWVGFALPCLGAIGFASAVTRLLYPNGSGGSMREALTNVELELFRSLVSPHHGVFSWSPILAVALVGIPLFSRRKRLLGALMLLVLLGEWYLSGTNFPQEVDRYHFTRHWAGGGGFGARRYLCCLPLFAVGLAHILRERLVLRPRPGACCGRRRWFAVIGRALPIGVLVSWGALLTVASRVAPHKFLEEEMTWEGLLSLALLPLTDPNAVLQSWFPGSPGMLANLGGVGLLGVLVSSIAAMASGYRRLPPRPQVLAVLGLAGIATGGAWLGYVTLEANTVVHAAEALTELREWNRQAAKAAPRVHFEIRVEQARLKRISGDLNGAIRRYEEAFQVGLGALAVRDYLDIVRSKNGPAGADRALARLHERFPGHVVLRPYLGLGVERDGGIK